MISRQEKMVAWSTLVAAGWSEVVRHSKYAEGKQHSFMGLEVELEKGKCPDNCKVFGTSNWVNGNLVSWDEENQDEQTGDRKNPHDLSEHVKSERFVRHLQGDQKGQLGA